MPKLDIYPNPDTASIHFVLPPPGSPVLQLTVPAYFPHGWTNQQEAAIPLVAASSFSISGVSGVIVLRNESSIERYVTIEMTWEYYCALFPDTANVFYAGNYGRSAGNAPTTTFRIPPDSSVMQTMSAPLMALFNRQRSGVENAVGGRMRRDEPFSAAILGGTSNFRALVHPSAGSGGSRQIIPPDQTIDGISIKSQRIEGQAIIGWTAEFNEPSSAESPTPPPSAAFTQPTTTKPAKGIKPGKITTAKQL